MLTIIRQPPATIFCANQCNPVTDPVEQAKKSDGSLEGGWRSVAERFKAGSSNRARITR